MAAKETSTCESIYNARAEIHLGRCRPASDCDRLYLAFGYSRDGPRHRITPCRDPRTNQGSRTTTRARDRPHPRPRTTPFPRLRHPHHLRHMFLRLGAHLPLLRPTPLAAATARRVLGDRRRGVLRGRGLPHRHRRVRVWVRAGSDLSSVLLSSLSMGESVSGWLVSGD